MPKLRKSQPHQVPSASTNNGTPTKIEQDSNQWSDSNSAADRAFFGSKAKSWWATDDGTKVLVDEPDEDSTRKNKRNGPLMRLRKKINGFNPEVADGLDPYVANPRMRIRSLNAKMQATPSESDQPPSEVYVTTTSRRPLVILLAYIVVLSTLHPSRTLQLILTSLMFFASFPVWMPWWTVLVSLVLPMGLQARFEVTMCMCMVLWLTSLEWEPVWNRVVKWVWDC